MLIPHYDKWGISQPIRHDLKAPGTHDYPLQSNGRANDINRYAGRQRMQCT